jgi:hypothetical protein
MDSENLQQRLNKKRIAELYNFLVHNPMKIFEAPYDLFHFKTMELKNTISKIQKNKKIQKNYK